MKRKGFTLVELLVVLTLIALLMGILMPALSRARQLAFRVTCGANLYGIGRAMLVYAGDCDNRLPRAGGRTSGWGPVGNWTGTDRYAAYGVSAAGEGGSASINSCFYLLVKYAEVTPKSFVCRGDIGAREFSLSELSPGAVPLSLELTDAWDFGPAPDNLRHCSYSYHMPFGRYALRVSDDPGLAVAADRNPWLASPTSDPAPFTSFQPDRAPWHGSREKVRAGNAVTHQSDGQNVLFLDGHVEFARRSYCSVEDDNIYTISDRPATGSPLGLVPPARQFDPANRNDSVLVHDPGQWQNLGPGGGG